MLLSLLGFTIPLQTFFKLYTKVSRFCYKLSECVYAPDINGLVQLNERLTTFLIHTLDKNVGKKRIFVTRNHSYKMNNCS